MLAELHEFLDLRRVHFLGKVPYPTFMKVLYLSRVHVYLTYPFVPSWSMLEAMAAGSLVVGARTAPVKEMIQHGANGLLIDFFDPTEIADPEVAALEDRQTFAEVRLRARQTVVENYDLKTICLSAQLKLLDRLVTAPRG